MKKCHCLVCNENFDILEVGTKSVEQLNKHEMWNVFCSHFNINPEEWKQVQNNYNCQDNLPFCQKCLIHVESLLSCHIKIQSLQRKVQHTVAHLSANILQLHNSNNNDDKESENDQLCCQIRLMRKNIAQNYQPHVVLPHSKNTNIILDKQKSSMIEVGHQSISNNNNNNNNNERKEQKRSADNMNNIPSTTTSTPTFTTTSASSSSANNSTNAEHLYHSNKKAKNDFSNGTHVSNYNSNSVLEDTTGNRYPSSNFFTINPNPLYSTLNISSRIIKCPKCHRPFLNLDDLKRHTTLRGCGDTFHPIIDITNKWHWIVDTKTGQKSWFYDAVWPVEVVTGTIGDTYKCGSCQMPSGISISREDVGDHIYLVHIAPNSVLCPEPGCGRNCSSSYHLELHKATAHTYKPYKCGECDLSFKLESTLAFHKKLIHKPKEMEVIEIPQPEKQQQNQQEIPTPKSVGSLRHFLKREHFIQNTAPSVFNNIPAPLIQFQEQENVEAVSQDPLNISSFVQVQLKSESDIIVPEVPNPYENFYDEAEMEEDNQDGNNVNDKTTTMNNPNIIIKEGPDVIDLTLDDEENENDVIVVKEEGIFFYKRWSYVHAQHEGDQVFGCLSCGEMFIGHENTVNHIQIKHENAPDIG